MLFWHICFAYSILLTYFNGPILAYRYAYTYIYIHVCNMNCIYLPFGRTVVCHMERVSSTAHTYTHMCTYTNI